MAIVNHTHSGTHLRTVSSMAMVEGEMDKEYRIYRYPGISRKFLKNCQSGSGSTLKEDVLVIFSR